MVLKTSRSDCCDHVPHPIVTLIYRDVTTLCLVYTTQIPLSQFAVQPNGKWPKSGRTQMKIRMWVHWTSCTSLGQHPIVALQPLILLHIQWPVLPAWFQFFHLHNTLNYPNTNIKKNINKNKFVTINKKILTLLHIQLKNMKLFFIFPHLISVKQNNKASFEWNIFVKT